MQSLCDHFAMMLVAPRRSGKSFFVQTMLREGLTERFDYIFVYSPSNGAGFERDDFLEFRVSLPPFAEKTLQERPIVNCDGEELSPTTPLLPVAEREKFHFSQLPRIEDLQRLMKEQQTAVEQVSAKHLQGDFREREPNTLLILDDCIGCAALNYGAIIDHIAATGRHYNLSLIVVSQQLNRVPKTTRVNCDYVIMFRPNNLLEFQQFLEQFVFRWARKEAMKRFIQAFEKPHRFLVIDNVDRDVDKRIGVSDAHSFLTQNPEEIKLTDLFEVKSNSI